MRAQVFFTQEAVSPCPVHLVSAEQWPEWQKTADEATLNFFKLYAFQGRPGDVAVISDAEGKPARVYACFQGQAIGLALASVAQRLPAGDYRVVSSISETDALFWALAQYQFEQYRASERPVRRLVAGELNLQQVLIDAEAVFLVRDLINTPANDMGPEQLAAAASALAATCSAEFRQWVGDELLEHGFPAIHAVGRAAAAAPRMIQLRWGNPKHPKLALVGKGVCFDSGGLDIKPAIGMRLMKKDMGGAAHVLGLAQAIMQAGLPVYLQVYIPAVENSISSQSFRPGDVLTMRNGLTVEIDNTDAEGRLVLADALVKAAEDGAELIVDFATLTGAARVAVGTELAAYFTDDEPLAQALEHHARQTRDPVWRLPLHAAYRPMLDSKIAHLVNCTSLLYAGAITAGLFLKEFVQKQVPWIHFDIMAWNLQSTPGKPEGGEAMGLRAMYALIAEWSSKT